MINHTPNKNLPPKPCEDCKEDFKPTSRTQLRCDNCRKARHEAEGRVWTGRSA